MLNDCLFDTDVMIQCYTCMLKFLSCYNWRIAGVVSCMDRCDRLVDVLSCRDIKGYSVKSKFIIHCKDYIRLAWFCTVYPLCLVLEFCINHEMFPSFCVDYMLNLELSRGEQLRFFIGSMLKLDTTRLSGRVFGRMVVSSFKEYLEDHTEPSVITDSMLSALLHTEILIEIQRVLYHEYFGRTRLLLSFPVEIRFKIWNMVISTWHTQCPVKAISCAHALMNSCWYQP